MMHHLPVLALLAAIPALRAAAEPSLVPEAPSTVPDYFCTWNVQGFACSYSGASPQADMMVEASLFGTGPNQNWLGFYPEIRADLTFLLDDAFDFPIGGGHNDPHRGSIELDPGRFPSYKGTPAERLAQLSKDVKARGWRDLGLWICNSRPNVDERPIDSDTYWCERLAWSQKAGIGSWKVDWGIGMPGKPLWKFKLTPKARASAPDVWMESGAGSDLYRTYDVNILVSIPETIRRIGAFLAKEDPKDRRIINCEDEVYIGAGTGASYGIMRHPLTGSMPNGKPDAFFVPHYRDIKRHVDEVVRAIRWHRIVQPFPKGDPYLVDEIMLTDLKCKPAPARIARGGMALPLVSMPDGGKEPPYVLCCRHPDGEIAVAAIPRNPGENGRQKLVFPLADVTLDAGKLDRPVGIFGEYASLTLATTSDLAGKQVLAQDLAGNTPADITAEVKIAGGKLTIPGAVLHRVGLMAARPGDLSDPGLVLIVKGLATFVPRKPMKPVMYMAPSSKPTAASAASGVPAAQKLPHGTPAKLHLTADKATLPDDGTEIRVTVAVLDPAGKPIGNIVKGQVTITAGKGLFPTGETFDFTTRNGQDSIEFRSYDRGQVVLTASSTGLEPGNIEITVVGSSKPE
jgi:hypothetical protein